MSEYDYDKNYGPWLTAAGITPPGDPTSLRGVIHAILQNLNGSSAPSVTTPTLGAAAQLAQTTQVATVYLDVSTAGNLTVAIGPTSGVADTLFTGTSPIQMMTVRLPPAWFIKVATTNTAVWSATVVNGV